MSKTSQKEFRDFERQWSAITAKSRADRKEGVGLLTPRLLQKHIESGEALTLDYGSKGLTVTYTPEELKDFAAAIKRSKGKHKANLAGVPLMHLEAMSSAADHLKAKDIKASTFYKINGNILYFRATASGETVNAPRHYQVRIRLDGWYDELSAIGPYLQRAKRACMGRVSIDCGCGRHQYWFRYLAGVGNFAVTPPGEKDFPKIRNPKLTGACCKHVLKTLRVLKSLSLHAILAKELERQAGAEGYAEQQGKRFLKTQELQQTKRVRGSGKASLEMIAAYKQFKSAKKAFAKKIQGKDMQKKIMDLEAENKVRSAKVRALKAQLKAQKASEAKRAEADQRKFLVQRIADSLTWAKELGIDRDKALGKLADRLSLTPESLQTIIEEEGL